MKTILTGIASFLFASLCLMQAAEPSKPNIIFILADDLGYGDVQCLNPERSKVPTPSIDRLAKEGMTFTDAHTSSSVCTPTRYSILTGRYNWRTKMQSGVLGGYSPPLIAKHRLTVPSLLRQQGYTTTCIGKWHLGMGIPNEDPSPTITDGPITRGFDRYFGISASLDMPPFAFIDNDRFTEPLTTTKKWLRHGRAAAGFEAVDVIPTFAQKAVEFIAQQAKGEKPFFLYMPLTSPHTPIVPSQQWQGKSAIGEYGDFLMQTDWVVGQVLEALEKASIADNTLLIFTADNGCAKAADIPKMQALGHFPSGSFRGSKSDIWEGGHRVPFFARWPQKIKPGTRFDKTICQVDLMATCAEITQAKLPETAGEDSSSFLAALTGDEKVSERPPVVHHSIEGAFAIREGQWKLALSPGSAGWTAPNDPDARSQGLPETQLYDLSADPGETKNLQAEHPEKVAHLTKLLEALVANGRSTPGAQQANDTQIQIRKPAKKPKAAKAESERQAEKPEKP